MTTFSVVESLVDGDVSKVLQDSARVKRIACHLHFASHSPWPTACGSPQDTDWRPSTRAARAHQLRVPQYIACWSYRWISHRPSCARVQTVSTETQGIVVEVAR